MTEWIDYPTAAQRMNVSEKTIRNYIKAGYLRAYRFGPRIVRINADELEASLVEVA